MAESNYQKQTWKKYDAEKDILTNIAQGGVATSERLNHMEDGIEKANIPYTVGNVTTGQTASVTINDDNSIDFVFPQNTGGGVAGDSGSNFTVSTASPSPENTIAKSDVLNSDDVSEGDLIMCPDGAIYEVITVGADNFTVENKNVSINTGGGKSAYDIWKEQPGNEGKSEEEFLESLKGEPGDAGIQGATGQSAYELWKTQFGNENKSEQDFLDSLKGDKGDPGDVGPTGADGQSAYELWKSQEGNESKTETDFLNALKGAAGEAGEDGQSAYELWKSQPGNENKTEKEFLASLKGEKGDPGQSTGEGGGTMAIGHPTLGAVSVLNEGSNDVKLSVKYTDPANEGVPYGGMLVAVKEDSYPESPTDCDWSVDVMTKDKHKSTALEIPIENNKGTERNLYLTLFPYSSDRVYNMLKREKWSKEGVKFLDQSWILEEKDRYTINSNVNDHLLENLKYGIQRSDNNIYFTNRYGSELYKYDPSTHQIDKVASISEEEKKKVGKYSEGVTITDGGSYSGTDCGDNIIEYNGDVYVSYIYAASNISQKSFVSILKLSGDQLTVFANLDNVTLASPSGATDGCGPCTLSLSHGKIIATVQSNDTVYKSPIAIIDTDGSVTYNNSGTDIYFVPKSNRIQSSDKNSFYCLAEVDREVGLFKFTYDTDQNKLSCEIVEYNKAIVGSGSSPSLTGKNRYVLTGTEDKFIAYADFDTRGRIIIKRLTMDKDKDAVGVPETTVLDVEESGLGTQSYISLTNILDNDSLLTVLYYPQSSVYNTITAVKIGLKNES